MTTQQINYFTDCSGLTGIRYNVEYYTILGLFQFRAILN